MLDDAISENLDIDPDLAELPDDPDEPDGEAKAGPMPPYDDMAPNLVPVFRKSEKGKAALKRIITKVIDDFQSAFDSCQAYRERHAADWKLFAGELPPKSGPFADSANPHVPIMLENITRLSFRIQAELFGDWTNVFGVAPTGPDDQDQAEILTLHGNWQIREQLVDFPRQMDRAVLAYLTWGDVVCHSYWDDDTKRNKHEVLTPDDFVMPYVHVSVQPDLSDVPYYCRIFRLYKYNLLSMEKRGWVDVDVVLEDGAPSWDDEPESLFRQSVSETTGHEMPDVDDEKETAPFTVIWYEGWIKLPLQESHRWVKVVFHKETRTIMQLQICEDDDWRDVARFEKQQSELAMFQQAMAEYQTNLQAFSTGAQMAGQAGMTPMELGMMMPPPPPEPPDWLMERPDGQPKLPRMGPIRQFTHAVCIENLAGGRGLSFGRIQSDFNRAANVALSQFTDAASLGNCSTLVTTGAVQWEQPFSFGPGKVNVVKGLSGDELKSNIMEMKPDRANDQLTQIVQMLYSWGQSSVQAPAVLSGESGKSGETYRGLSARLEQATKQISFAARKFANTFLKPVLMNNAMLNSKFLDDYELINIMDWRLSTMRAVELSRDMYRPGYNVEIRADMRFASDSQRVQESLEMLQLPGMVPPLQHNLSFIHAALKQYLEAKRMHHMIPLLGPPPPPPQTPLGLPPPPPPPPPGMGGPPGGPPPRPGGPPPGHNPTGGPNGPGMPMARPGGAPPE